MKKDLMPPHYYDEKLCVIRLTMESHFSDKLYQYETRISREVFEWIANNPGSFKAVFMDSLVEAISAQYQREGENA